MARFLERASRLHLNELLVGPSSIEEVPLDAETGRSRIVVLGLDGSLFFAHAAILAQRLGAIVDRQPEAIVLRLRRAQQIDYSVLTALDATLEPHFAGGGRVYVCGLSPILHQTIAASDLGRRIGGDALFPSSRQLWSSLADALKTAEAALTPSSDRPVRRVR